ncbi:MAG TPA: tyrosine recombinase XerC, partial [Anaerolineae bacterium]|nr:tyrosine recombinase XerC [Anaerolineae bacterium]
MSGDSDHLQAVERQLEGYIAHLRVEKDASPYTLRNYSHEIQQFLDFLRREGIDSWEAVDRQALRRYLLWLRKQGYVEASMARKLSELRSFCRYLIQEGALGSNPFDTVSSPKVPKRLPRYLKLEEIELLLAAPDLSTPLGQRDRAILELLYAAGVRLSELVSLDLGHLTMESGQMVVWGKGGKERLVLLGEPAVRALRAYISDGRARLLGNKTTNALFLNRFGRRLSRRSIGLILDKYSKLAGLWKKVTPHLLRHTFATHLLEGGANLRVVQELLGHAQPTTTEIYTHVTPSRLREV